MNHARKPIVDATVTFLSSNPDLVSFASARAAACGASVDALLADAGRRMVEKVHTSAPATRPYIVRGGGNLDPGPIRP